MHRAAKTSGGEQDCDFAELAYVEDAETTNMDKQQLQLQQ